MKRSLRIGCQMTPVVHKIRIWTVSKTALTHTQTTREERSTCAPASRQVCMHTRFHRVKRYPLQSINPLCPLRRDNHRARRTATNQSRPRRSAMPPLRHWESPPKKAVLARGWATAFFGIPARFGGIRQRMRTNVATRLILATRI